MRMNENNHRLKALGNFIKSCRAKLTPDSVGLPLGYNRRRIPGLRREEVAQLAGVSTTWYTWLEQGRDIHVSKQILDCIGQSLRLNPDEYIHMMNLAQFPVDPSTTWWSFYYYRRYLRWSLDYWVSEKRKL